MFYFTINTMYDSLYLFLNFFCKVLSFIAFSANDHFEVSFLPIPFVEVELRCESRKNQTLIDYASYFVEVHFLCFGLMVGLLYCFDCELYESLWHIYLLFWSRLPFLLLYFVAKYSASRLFFPLHNEGGDSRKKTFCHLGKRGS